MVVLKDTEDREIKRWNFFRAFPCHDRSTFAVERIEIAHEGLEVDNDLAEVSNGVATPIGKNWNDAQNVTSVCGKREPFKTTYEKTLHSSFIDF